MIPLVIETRPPRSQVASAAESSTSTAPLLTNHAIASRLRARCTHGRVPVDQSPQHRRNDLVQWIAVVTIPQQLVHPARSTRKPVSVFHRLWCGSGLHRPPVNRPPPASPEWLTGDARPRAGAGATQRGDGLTRTVQPLRAGDRFQGFAVSVRCVVPKPRQRTPV
jgi:hypothetical protein